MIAAWMIFAALVAGLIWVSGDALERAARATRQPARFVWVLALATSLLVTGARLLPPAGHGDAAPSPASATLSTLPPGQAGPPAGAQGARTAAVSNRLLWIDSVPVPVWLAEADGPLALIWTVGSLLWCLILVGSSVRLRRRRAHWRPEAIDGQPVYVSHDEGPALFGLARYSIVVPSWVVELGPRERSLVLAHEREHARAADPVVLLLGALSVMVQPWNPFAWLMFQRLRFAVEADCDSRVLARTREVRTYGELLIDLGERTLAGAAPVAALSEPHTHLEKRVALMTRLPLRRPMLRGLGWVALSALSISAACRVPRPVAAQQPTDAGARSQRTIVHITSVAGPAGPFRIEIFAPGPARVGLGLDSLSPLRDTLRLDHLPAMRLDVTESDVHVRLVGEGRITLAGEVTGGPAIRVSATGREIVLFKGGTGIGPVPESANRAVENEPAANRPPLATAGGAVAPRAAQPVGEEPPLTDPDQIRRAPTYTPFARAPLLMNRADVINALPLLYPAAFDGTGLSATATVWLLVEADGGTPSKVLIRKSSGYPEMDDAALKAARLMRFFHATNEKTQPTMVWIALPITIRPSSPLQAADSIVVPRVTGPKR